MNFKEQAERGELMLPEIALELSKLEKEAAYWRDEAFRWRHAHESVVISKRKLSAKYGRIMRWTPRAIRRRLTKWVKRCVTNVTHKLSQVR